MWREGAPIATQGQARAREWDRRAGRRQAVLCQWYSSVLLHRYQALVEQTLAQATLVSAEESPHLSLGPITVRYGDRAGYEHIADIYGMLPEWKVCWVCVCV